MSCSFQIECLLVPVSARVCQRIIIEIPVSCHVFRVVGVQSLWTLLDSWQIINVFWWRVVSPLLWVNFKMWLMSIKTQTEAQSCGLRDTSPLKQHAFSPAHIQCISLFLINFSYCTSTLIRCLCASVCWSVFDYSSCFVVSVTSSWALLWSLSFRFEKAVSGGNFEI